MKRLVMILVLILCMCACSKSDDHKIVLKSDTVKVLESINPCRLIENIDGVKIGSEDVIEDDKLYTSEFIVECPSLDTSELGEKEITFTINDKDYLYKINVIDDEAPVIHTSDATFLLGEEIDLNGYISVTDNYNEVEDIDVSIKGDYDLNKVGSYDIEIIAKDGSENESSKKITLEVIEDLKKIEPDIEIDLGSDTYLQDTSKSHIYDDGNIRIESSSSFEVNNDAGAIIITN